MSEIRINPDPVPADDAEALELERIKQYQACFMGPAGEYVLRDLISTTDIGSSLFQRAEFNPTVAAGLDGAQSVVWRCLNYSGRRDLL